MAARLAIVALCLFGTSAALASATRSEQVPVREPFATFPMQIATWRGEREPDFDENIRRELGTDEYLNAMFRDPKGGDVGLYIGYYPSQRQGGAIHSPANCLPGAGWQPIEAGRLGINAPLTRTESNRIFDVNRWIIQKGDEQQLVLYWYQSHGRVIASEYSSKIHLVFDSIRLHRTDAALVRVMSPIGDASTGARIEAERSAVSFVKSVFPLLGRFLPV